MLSSDRNLFQNSSAKLSRPKSLTCTFQKRGSLTEAVIPFYPPKTVRSAPVTPCDSETSWYNNTWIPQPSYERPVAHSSQSEASTSEKHYDEGLWWWRRPLDVRRTQCRRCGASSSSRPLRMMPCAGVPQDEDVRRPLMSRDRPLLFVRQLFL